MAWDPGGISTCVIGRLLSLREPVDEPGFPWKTATSYFLQVSLAKTAGRPHMYRPGLSARPGVFPLREHQPGSSGTGTRASSLLVKRTASSREGNKAGGPFPCLRSEPHLK
ncbi:hypothetical protein Bbelb_424180 [Branchiostoma belcheri]|nr:hypothetical protein Bbelb_424180 [Branchiostoma belcheri]